ncbi:MAG: DUF819 family protein [Lachnospiraceae bacterium]|nr:DUF819 family protein [Lachnospiraceae bacterium]
MTTLISADDHWMLIMIMFLSTAAAIYLEQRFAWASKISGAIITLIVAVVLVNTGIIPTSAPVFDDVVWGYAVPLAIPLLLLKTNIRRIGKEAGRFLIIFLIGSCGTVAGAFLGTVLLGRYIQGIEGVAAVMTGSYIGGGVNFTAVSDAFHVDPTLISATTVADNLNMAVYFVVLLSAAGSAWFNRHYSHPHIDEVKRIGKSEDQTTAAAYWGRKDISLKDIAVCMAYSAAVVCISRLIGSYLSDIIPDGNFILQMLKVFFGSQYVWITNFSVLFATVFEKKALEMHGAEETGTWLIYLFYFVIGVPASIVLIIKQAPILLILCMLMVFVNMLFSFVFGKILKFDLEEIILASNANIGGPTTAAGMAISQGWNKLVGPSVLVGTLGYAIGTWLGILVGSLLGA